MPCIYEETVQERMERLARLDKADHKKNLEAKIADNLAEREAMLCAVLSAISYVDGGAFGPPGAERLFNRVLDYIDAYTDEHSVDSEQVQIWWERHKEADRVRKQKIRENALNKLTDEERRVLGIKNTG
jgi:hypothetical protein